MRNLLTLLLVAASATASAAPPCGPTEMSLGMLSNFATTQRYAEQCSVPKSAIEREITSSIKLLRSCLEARNIPAATLDQTLQNGARLGDQGYAMQTDKAAFCTRIKASFGK